jgi:hypothetical protein
MDGLSILFFLLIGPHTESNHQKALEGEETGKLARDYGFPETPSNEILYFYLFFCHLYIPHGVLR